MAGFSLPNEIWCMIFSYLPLAPKKNATATCKLWSRLIREDSKLSGHILISWYNMKTALETLQWNWSNWPALETFELNKLEFIEDSRFSVKNVIYKLSLKHHCPPRLKEVIFDMDLSPIQTNCQSILKYQPYTNQIFGLGQELDSPQKWSEFDSKMKALKRLKSMGFNNLPNSYPVRGIGPIGRILKELEALTVQSGDLLSLIASPDFQTYRLLDIRHAGHSLDSDLVQYDLEFDVWLDAFLNEFDRR